MTKKAHKLSEEELLTELELTSHLPPPEFPEIKTPKLYVRSPSDVGEFVQLYGLVPVDLREAELILCSRLYDFYLEHLSRIVKKNAIVFGRDVAACGLIRVRRVLHGKRNYFYVVNNNNRLKMFFKTNSEGDDEKRQRQTVFRIERKKWEHLSRFKKGTC